jgi:ankyrin repeat protein
MTKRACLSIALVAALVPCSCIGVALYRNDLNERLVQAAYSGDVSAASGLLRQGADPNYRFEGYQSPLLGAVWKEDTAMVRLLLSNGARPDLAMDDGSTPLSICENDIIRQMLLGALE